MTPDLLSVAVRALTFVALFQAAGAAFFLAILGHRLARAREPIRRLGWISAAVGTVLVFVHLWLDGARLSGDFDGLWDRDLQQLAWASKSGISQIAQATGLLGVMVALWRTAQNRVGWASLGGVLAVGAFLLTGHTSAHALRAVLAPLLALHLFIVAFWFGSLIPLAVVLRVEDRETAADLLKRFSSVSAWLVPVILLAGISMAWILASSLRVLGQPYGQLLMVKLAGFGLLMLLAAANKWRLARAFEQGSSDTALRRSFAVEWVLIVAILSVTAVLTSFYSPD
jgi:putative copper resistance protein D